MLMPEIVTVATGLSEDSATLRLARRLASAAAEAVETGSAGPEVVLTEINLRTLARELAGMAVSGLAAPALEEAFAAVQRADALITVAPVYNGQPIGLHTLFFQLIDDAALSGTPVLIGTTGGTARHSLAAETSLRPLLSYLKGILVPTSVFAATDDWGADTSGMGTGSPLAARITAAGAELAAFMGTRLAARTGEQSPGEQLAAEQQAGQTIPAPNRAVDELDPEAITPFAQLLHS